MKSMNATKYDLTYACAEYAFRATRDLDKIVNALKQLNEPKTCKELGMLIYGEEYKRIPSKEGYESWDYTTKNTNARKLTGTLSKALFNLMKAGYVEVTEGPEETFTYMTTEWYHVDESNQPEFIDVWDKEGNAYKMPNPKYNHMNTRLVWREIPKEGHRPTKMYKWVKE